MYAYNEIKEFLLNFNNGNPTVEEQNKLKEIATQLNFTYHDCGCKSLWAELYKKLTIWLKNHTELCHYTMPTGMLLYTKDKELVTATNITDYLAEKIIAEGTYAYRITRILPQDEEEQPQTITNEEVADLKEKVATVEKQKSGKRKVRKETK